MEAWSKPGMHSRVCIMTNNLVMAGARSLDISDFKYTVEEGGKAKTKKVKVAYSRIGKFDIEPATVALRFNRGVHDLSPEERKIYVRREFENLALSGWHKVEPL